MMGYSYKCRFGSKSVEGSRHPDTGTFYWKFIGDEGIETRICLSADAMDAVIGIHARIIDGAQKEIDQELKA